MGEVILTMKDIDKSFPGVHALDHVNFEVKRGEVHALMGENGAGKSTLMKVLTGIYQKDSGSITYKGKETEFHNTREAQDAGVVIVHQELNMVGDLTDHVQLLMYDYNAGILCLTCIVEFCFLSFVNDGT